MTDGDGKRLMLKFQSTGDSEACRRLFFKYRDPLWRFLLRMNGSEVEANDMSQQTWLKVVEAAERNAYRPRDNAKFQTWLFTIARNLVIDSARTLRAKSELIGDDMAAPFADESAPAIGDIIDNQSAVEGLRTAIATLPYEQREVLAMWAEGFSFAEIAVVVNAPRNTVIGRKNYGMDKLRTAMARNAAKDRLKKVD